MNFDVAKSVTRGEALSLLAENWQVPNKTEIITVSEAIGRVTAAPLFVQYNVPVYRTSSLDGIAVNSKYFTAGLPDTSSWVMGQEYVRADTGDDFPDAYDTVIAIEDISLENGVLKIDPELKFSKGDLVRAAGNMAKKGEQIVDKNVLITPELASMLVFGGIRQLAVIRKPRIVYIPTGDELIYAGEVPYRGQTLESNSLMVKGYGEAFGAEVDCFPIIRDDKAALQTALDQALLRGDIVLINGGSSKGSEDFNSAVIQERAQFFRHGIKAVPGRPVGISVIDNIPVINVPGPAIACFLALDWCVRGLVSHYYGIKPAARPMVKVKIAAPIKKKKDFEMYIRYRLVKENNQYVGYPISRSESIISVFSHTMAMFIAPIGVSSYEAGSEIEMELMCSNEYLQAIANQA